MAFDKWAVDEAAKKYWENYYKEYGKSWVRDIPRRVKKAMVESKTASDNGIVTPVGKAVSDNGVVLEGMYRTDAGNFLFRADFDHEGNITSFDASKLAEAQTE